MDVADACTPVLWRSVPDGAVSYVYAGNLVACDEQVIAIFQPVGAPTRKRTGRRGGAWPVPEMPTHWSVDPAPAPLDARSRVHPADLPRAGVLTRFRGAGRTRPGWTGGNATCAASAPATTSVGRAQGRG
jgi:hypothetical protein